MYNIYKIEMILNYNRIKTHILMTSLESMKCVLTDHVLKDDVVTFLLKSHGIVINKWFHRFFKIFK